MKMNQPDTRRDAPSQADVRRRLPAVHRVVEALGIADLPRAMVTAVVRRVLADARRDALPASLDWFLAKARTELARIRRMRLQPVINGTGIVLHTNLGRAPLAEAAVRAIADAAHGYTSLEYDLDSAGRGRRGGYVEEALALACGAEAATVVNNGAAALMLVVRHFTRNKPEVLISRGELVQIGGGFRIPEIIEASGAHLREVGTTNRTTLDDYRRGLGDATGLVLKVHRSNFSMHGFVDQAGTSALAELARDADVPFCEDLGSGALVATESLGAWGHEPTVAEVLGCGAHVVTFSGDKLLGGPQAGILAGNAAGISALRRDPFYRALRCDKLVLAALEATMDAYLNEEAVQELPALALLAVSTGTLQARARQLAAELRSSGVPAEVAEVECSPGGGSLPEAQARSAALVFAGSGGELTAFATRLRHGVPPVIGYLQEGRFTLDLRTVFPNQEPALMSAVRESWLGLRGLGAGRNGTDGPAHVEAASAMPTGRSTSV